MAHRRIVLASSSPRRQELLSKVGLDFEIIPAEFDESAVSGAPDQVVKALALEKASEVARQLGVGLDAVVIGADTIVYIDGKILGKPADDREAGLMLGMISGRTHVVYTGIAMIDTLTGKTLVECEESRVHIRELAPDEIAAYVRTGEPSDKAGAYAVQGVGSVIVDRIEGCYFNVVGLPMSRLALMLKEFGVSILG
ncbi:MAG: Maf family protein [Bacillota bacterium]|nr:Maf family protein [Bacillota bacterium]